jgi:hypothetical protein
VSTSDWTYLAARTSAEFQNGGHRTYFVPSLVAVAATANDVAAFATLTSNYATAAAGSYALQLALGTGAYGVGAEPLRLPRNAELGTAAYADLEVVRGYFPNLQNAAYQMVLADAYRLTYCTSGTNTFTLPLGTDLPDGWSAPLRNRSGANLTVARTGADTINGTTSATIATGNTTSWIFKTGSASFEVG